VREMENEIERLCVLAGDAEVIPPELRSPHAAKAPGNAAHLAALVQSGLGSDLATAVSALEKELIETGLRETHGNRSRLAERLGVSRTTLIKKIRDYGLAG
jgi:two-component system response regulator HupR/HoxA